MSGQFTIGHPDANTGKSHLVAVKCDLCKTEATFDPGKDNLNNRIYEIIGQHVCEKPKKDIKKKRSIRFPRPKIMENVFGSRRQRIGPPEQEDEDATV